MLELQKQLTSHQAQCMTNWIRMEKLNLMKRNLSKFLRKRLGFTDLELIDNKTWCDSSN